MSKLFDTPAEHAANPPASWVVAPVGLGFYELRTKDGRVLCAAMRGREECEALKVASPKYSGRYVALYEREWKWFAGDPEEETHWPPYLP